MDCATFCVRLGLWYGGYWRSHWSIGRGFKSGLYYLDSQIKGYKHDWKMFCIVVLRNHQNWNKKGATVGPSNTYVWKWWVMCGLLKCTFTFLIPKSQKEINLLKAQNDKLCQLKNTPLPLNIITLISTQQLCGAVAQVLMTLGRATLALITTTYLILLTLQGLWSFITTVLHNWCLYTYLRTYWRLV